MPFQPTYPVPEERLPYTEYGQNSPSHGRIGILMLHGFMGSPLSSHPMARYLAEHGITVHCPLLPGHGHWPDKLHGVNRQQWLATAEEALAYTRTLCDEIFLMGHSMGTILCTHLALNNQDIRGQIMLTPVYETPDARLNWLKLLRPFMTWFYPSKMPSKSLQRLVRERLLDFYPDLDLDDPAVQQRIPQMSRLPVAAITEMLKMVDYGRTLFPQLTLPTLIFHGGHDPAIKPGSIEKLYDDLPSQHKQIKKFPDAGHELMRPLDPVHEIVWKMAFDFIYEHSRIRQQVARPA